MQPSRANPRAATQARDIVPRSSVPERARESVAHRARGALTAAAVIATVGGCYIGNQGLDPPLSFYYPTGLITSPGRSVLYVTNSDFDLQFNGGTVLTLDLATLRHDLLRPLQQGLLAATPC